MLAILSIYYKEYQYALHCLFLFIHKKLLAVVDLGFPRG